jgi:hypothetical protein
MRLRQTLAEHLAWLQRETGAKPCTCRHEWKSLGRLYGLGMGSGWVRVSTEAGCPEHADMHR